MNQVQVIPDTKSGWVCIGEDGNGYPVVGWVCAASRMLPVVMVNGKASFDLDTIGHEYVLKYSPELWKALAKKQ